MVSIGRPRTWSATGAVAEFRDYLVAAKAPVLKWRGRSLHVEVDRERAHYTLVQGDEPLLISHHGESFEVGGGDGDPVTRPIPPVRPRGNPTQPPGRAPARRSAR